MQTLTMFMANLNKDFLLFLNSNIFVPASLNEDFLLRQLFFQCYHTILSFGTGQPLRKSVTK